MTRTTLANPRKKAKNSQTREIELSGGRWGERQVNVGPAGDWVLTDRVIETIELLHRR